MGEGPLAPVYQGQGPPHPKRARTYWGRGPPHPKRAHRPARVGGAGRGGLGGPPGRIACAGVPSRVVSWQRTIVQRPKTAAAV